MSKHTKHSTSPTIMQQCRKNTAMGMARITSTEKRRGLKMSQARISHDVARLILSLAFLLLPLSLLLHSNSLKHRHRQGKLLTIQDSFSFLFLYSCFSTNVSRSTTERQVSDRGHVEFYEAPRKYSVEGVENGIGNRT